MIGKYWWRTQPEYGTDVGTDVIDHLRNSLSTWARTFAEQRLGDANIEFRMGSRKLLIDEAHSFLAAIDGGHIDVNDAGYITPRFCRPKTEGGCYSLFSMNTYSGDPYVSLNTEYLIHMGAAAELVTDGNWSPNEVLLEVGEYDAACEAGGRIVLVMEAKARVEGADSLSSLLNSFIRFADADKPPEPKDNHSRKYVELLRLAEAGPVTLLLVAAGARWALKAVRIGQSIDLMDIGSAVRPKKIESGTASGQAFFPEPNVDHACAVAALTECDRAQRVYEYPWSSKAEAIAFRQKLIDGLSQRGFVHARPWTWYAKTSDGIAKSPSGRDTGIEIRFSFYS